MAIKRIIFDSKNVNIMSPHKMNKVGVKKTNNNLYPTFFESYEYPFPVKKLSQYGIDSRAYGLSYKFVSLAPKTPYEENISQLNTRGSTVSVDYFYNYYAKQYEESIQNYDELQIPNIYATLKNGTTDPLDAENYITPNRRFFQNRKINKYLFKTPKSKKILVSADSLVDYSKYFNIVLSTGLSHSSELKKTKEQFPYGIKIGYCSSNIESKFRDFMISESIYEQFINSYIYRKKTNMPLSTHYDSYGNGLLENSTLGFKSVNFSELMESVDFSLSKGVNPRSLILNPMVTNFNSFSEFIKLTSLKSFYIKMLQEHSRDFKEICSGKGGYSEVLFYKVEKFVGNSLRRPIQVYYIPNTSGFFELIDTQVKVNKIYNYQITECRFVVNNDVEITSTNNNQGKSIISVRNTPSASLIEIPLHFEMKAVALPPPPPPMVKFSTKQNAEKNIFVELRPNYGDYRMDPVQIESEEEPQFNMLKMMSKGPKNKPAYRYYAGKIGYEVYRLANPPKDIESFRLNDRYDFDKIGLERTIRFADPAEKNKKYYYMARSYNSYGMKSIPSTIYEVELVQSGDDSKVVVSAYEFPKLETFSKVVSMKSLLQLIPASEQTLLSMDDEVDLRFSSTFENSLDDVRLGVARNPLWGKKFKIRITSTNTGRKVDLNVKFDIKKKKSNQEL